jgi:hypothetical protein
MTKVQRIPIYLGEISKIGTLAENKSSFAQVLIGINSIISIISRAIVNARR